jgi:hypothetical protein
LAKWFCFMVRLFVSYYKCNIFCSLNFRQIQFTKHCRRNMAIYFCVLLSH